MPNEDKKAIDAEECELGSVNESPEFVLQKQMLSVESGMCTKLAWRAVEVREHFRMVWKNDGDLLKKLFPLFDVKVQTYGLFRCS